jgi:hypothetical protein
MEIKNGVRILMVEVVPVISTFRARGLKSQRHQQARTARQWRGFFLKKNETEDYPFHYHFLPDFRSK